MRAINAFRAMLGVVFTTIALQNCQGQEWTVFHTPEAAHVKANGQFHDQGHPGTSDTSYSVVFRTSFFRQRVHSLRVPPDVQSPKLMGDHGLHSVWHPDRLEPDDAVRKRIVWMMQEMDLVRNRNLETHRRRSQHSSPEHTL